MNRRIAQVKNREKIPDGIGATVTLPVDVDFTGTVEVNGILQLALPRDGGSGADVMPRFSVVTGEASAVPEAGTIALLGAGALALLRRRRSVKRWGSGR